MLRAVGAEEASSSPIADAIHAIAREAAADGPVTVLIAWEKPNGELQARSFPRSGIVTEGHARRLHKLFVSFDQD